MTHGTSRAFFLHQGPEVTESEEVIVKNTLNFPDRVPGAFTAVGNIRLPLHDQLKDMTTCKDTRTSGL